MILGRSTVQWTGLIASAGGLTQLLLVTLVPGLDPVVIGTVIGAIIAFLGVFIAFVANTSTTPVDDPKLKVGTMMQITDGSGTVIGHEPVPQPPEPPPAG